MQENPDKVACLLDWCFTQGIRIDPRLEIKENGEAGISVFSRGGYISSTTTGEFPCGAFSRTTRTALHL